MLDNIIQIFAKKSPGSPVSLSQRSFQLEKIIQTHILNQLLDSVIKKGHDPGSELLHHLKVTGDKPFYL